jgi:putative peptidoglycan lipid II flippase
MKKNVALLFFGNLASKGLGVGREILTAGLFGTGQAVGAFRVAQTGTLAPANFFTSDALNSVFIPQYKRFKADSHDKAHTFFWSLCAVFGVLGLFISAALWLGASPWVRIVAPGIDPQTAALAVTMLQIMALGVPFFLTSALLMFLGMANDDFVPMAIRPVVQNIGMIVGALLAFLLHDVLFLGWGFTASYIAFSAWVLLRSFASGLLSLPDTWDWPQVSEVTRAFWLTLRPLLMLPVMLQGNIIVERAVASLIGLAAISALDYARFVSETIIFLVSVPVAFAGIAHWSGLDNEVIRQRLHKVLLLLIGVAVPFSTFLANHGHTVVEAIYARGAFDAESVRVTGDILTGIALGLWAQVIGYVLIKALNAQMRNRAVLRVMAAALLANVVFNVTMYPYLGPMTLGLGNSAYGLVLLAGTLTALGLWKQSYKAGWLMAGGSAGYLLLDNWIPLPEGTWAGLTVAGLFALTYWMAWIAMVPLLRNVVIEAIVPSCRRVP